MAEIAATPQPDVHEGRILHTATGEGTSPLAVDGKSYSATVATFRDSERSRVIPAVFGTGSLDLAPPQLERVQQRSDSHDTLQKSDVNAVLQDVLGTGGWSDAGKAAWKNMFNSVAGDPVDDKRATAALNYVAGAFKDVDMYAITDSKGTNHYYAGLVRAGDDNTVRRDHIAWLKTAQEAAAHGQPIPEVPKSLTTLTEVGEKALPKELAPLLADARNGKLTQAGVHALQDILKKDNDPKADDLSLMADFNNVKNRINSALGDKRLNITKTTSPDGTEHYVASLSTDSGKPIEIGTRPLPDEYKPILDAARGTGVPDNQPLKWTPAAKEAWKKAYDHFAGLPGASFDSIFSQLNELGARMNNAYGQDRVGMAGADFGAPGSGWVMTIGRTGEERIGAVGNPDTGVKLGPFQPHQKPAPKPGDHI
jgi:hypothetical protein